MYVCIMQKKKRNLHAFKYTCTQTGFCSKFLIKITYEHGTLMYYKCFPF